MMAYIAASEGHEHVLEFLDDLGTDLNTPNKDGITPISYAFHNGWHIMVNYLYKVSVKREKKLSIYSIVAMDDSDLLKDLDFLGGNVDLYEEDNEGKSLTFIATKNENLKLLELLQKMGVD